jgi:hypothetical protein
MTNANAGFTWDTLLRKKIDKLRRKEKDVRVHNRLSAVLWLGQGRLPEEVAELLGRVGMRDREQRSVVRRAWTGVPSRTAQTLYTGDESAIPPWCSEKLVAPLYSDASTKSV